MVCGAGVAAHVEVRAFALNHGAVIEGIADALDHRLEGDEVQHHPGAVQFSLQLYRHLIVVAMQRLALAIGEN